ncbi:SDR family oxidoreductase [Xanthobacter dioxanivorans]|uniref:SDR family oxidoreductase n=1 Tax=Xanthobacter dioxanivorans TaxID=2528964 RepID=A0A974PQ95_9HYPH|nr:SDR family NAD(P)-dependent oxidoreductase [Xanthobacter dioxanivorans]QRG07369.1 SDR family oxidoreductase [Xanthobacter dioxanivorans]
MSAPLSPVVFVTGAGRGIGRAMADAHADAGAAVAYVDHDPLLAEEAANAAALRGVKAVGLTADVADYAAVEAAARAAEAALGPVTVLVNNAGISPKSGADGRRAEAPDMDPAEWRRVIDVNLTGAFNCVRALSPGMKAMGRGRIINISSVAGRTYCDIVGVHYAASKAALIGFTKHLAGELGPYGITVNAIAPGRIDTPMVRGTAFAANEAVRLVTPLRRLGQPEDVAQVCCFLASDAGAFVTGQVIDVAGGWLLT